MMEQRANKAKIFNEHCQEMLDKKRKMDKNEILQALKER